MTNTSPMADTLREALAALEEVGASDGAILDGMAKIVRAVQAHRAAHQAGQASPAEHGAPH
ncbi:hypothetical protein [Tabrizicola caldifontis]|uniref:hypothetical protein n=1 Tax=Tabrizicola caldifontis TaxID=2528036 RepID=UPI00108039C0|nr:hypothetical protein [Rhodobacter sp. YIM 73028]